MGSLVVDSDGGVVALDGSGQVVAAVDAPWARDANGTEVPTRFVVEGSTLTQVVDHATASFAYPITADPAVWSWWGVTYYLNKRETGLVVLGMIPSTVLVSIPHWATRGVGWLLFSAASYAQVAQWWGACLAVSVNWVARSPYNQLGTRVWHYYGGYCR